MAVFGVLGNCNFRRKMTLFFGKSGTFKAPEHDFLSFQVRFMGSKNGKNE